MKRAYSYGYWIKADVYDQHGLEKSRAAELHSFVLTALERRNLCHTSIYMQSVFPWLTPVLIKIAEKKLSVDEKVHVLTFVSCLALFQQGRYVKFHALSTLELRGPLSQRVLIALEVQSKFTFPNVNTFKLYRLHPSIPWKLYLKRGVSETKHDETT